jgi:hypothetical protein
VPGMDGRRRCPGRSRRPRPLAGWMGPAGPGAGPERVGSGPRARPNPVG